LVLSILAYGLQKNVRKVSASWALDAAGFLT